jgi:ABC-type molybdenum transport system ATPase subunit/photorepair protein PhrA
VKPAFEGILVMITARAFITETKYAKFLLPTELPKISNDGIVFQNVSVIRSGRLVLRDVTLHIAAGEHVAIMGPNGRHFKVTSTPQIL